MTLCDAGLETKVETEYESVGRKRLSKAATYQALLDSPLSLINGDVGKCGST